MKDIQTASEKAFTSTKEAFISGRVTRIVKDGLKDVYGAMPSTESVKGTLSGIGNKLKNVCGTSVGYTMGTLELAKKTLGSIGGSTKEEKNVATENLSGLKVVALPYVATNTTIQKDPEISSPENQPTKEENGQSWVAWGKAKVAGIGVCGCVALYYAAPYISTMLEGVSVSSVGSDTNSQ
ncbi:hypothetical protein [Wolbachia endosymbiont (group A) of Clivina fossor]|uniref:hypothetical protein n=1 Tax=Wolbachia endosymbiont (group A) of Clivina fossor TaxID=3066133 RepID=UPI003132AB6E